MPFTIFHSINLINYLWWTNVAVAVAVPSDKVCWVIRFSISSCVLCICVLVGTTGQTIFKVNLFINFPKMVQRWFKVQNVYEMIRPFSFMTKLFGTIPFTITSAGDVHVTLFDVGILVIILFLNICYYTMNMDVQKIFNPSNSFILRIGFSLLETLGLAIQLYVPLKNLLYRRKITEIFQNIHHFDLEVCMYMGLPLWFGQTNWIFLS